MMSTAVTACDLTEEDQCVGEARYLHIHRRSPFLYHEDGDSGSVYQSTLRHSSDGANQDCSTYPKPNVNYPAENRK
jgi:hypothetical protein